MDAVFGSGNWIFSTYSTVSVANLFSNSTSIIYLEGGQIVNPIALNSFLSANISQLEAWVSKGGRLLINAAPNEGGNINLGFGGIILEYSPFGPTYTYTPTSFISPGQSGHPIFNGPQTPVGGNWSANFFGHAIISGAGITSIITGNLYNQAATGTVLAQKVYGCGVVLFGGMTPWYFHSPIPEATNLKRNILSYLKTFSPECSSISTAVVGQIFCPGSSISINYTATGSFNVDNVFTAELSDPNGSFAIPANNTIIGSVSSTTSGTISATIPAVIGFGTAYRVRVVSSNPQVVGSDNGSDLTIGDNQDPTAITQNVIAQLDANGSVTITADQINDGSSDNCTPASMLQLALSKTTFDCSNIGSNTVVLTVTDASGRTASSNGTVTVVDEVKPTVVTQPVTIYLNASGLASVSAAEVNNGSTDNCSIASYSLDKTSFTCADVGANTLTLTVIDVNGNAQSGTAVVTVVDNIKPAVVTQNIIVQLGSSGNAAITPAQIDNGSTDNCSIASYSLDKTNFTCADVGANSVTLTVIDVNGNSQTGSATVTVQDNIAPVALCQNISVYLDQNGTALVTPEQVDNGSSDACGITLSLSKTSFNTSDVGDNTVTLTAVDPSGNSSNCTAIITVKKRPVTLVYTGDGSEQYSDQQVVTAVLTDQLTNTVLSGKTIVFTIGIQSVSGVSNASGIASNSLVLTQNPLPTYTVNSNFAGDAIYLPGSDSDPFDITQEDARANYTGALFASTSCQTCSNATVTLSATVQDISATGDAAGDNLSGDIRLARVRFVNRDNGSAISGWLTPGLVNGADLRTGTVTFNWTVNIGSADAEQYTVGIEVDGYYTRNQGSDNAVINVAKPLNDFVTGGGFIVASNSAGRYASDPGTKNNFGFNVKYNKSGKNLQGKLNFIVRRMESGILKTYQIKGNVMTSLSIQGGTPAKAVYNGKANITDITNPLAPEAVNGNMTLQVEMTDRGEPGTSDSYALTVWNDNGGLAYSSNWNGTRSAEQVLAGGNLQVRGSAAKVSAPGMEADQMLDQEMSPLNRKPVLQVKVLPNPSPNRFTLNLSGGSNEPIQLRVTDVLGRVVEARKLPAGAQTVQVGDAWINGNYILEIIQGTERKTMQLVKLR
jgi:hypothetical protein